MRQNGVAVHQAAKFIMSKRTSRVLGEWQGLEHMVFVSAFEKVARKGMGWVILGSHLRGVRYAQSSQDMRICEHWH